MKTGSANKIKVNSFDELITGKPMIADFNDDRSYRLAKDMISSELNNMAESYCALGYYLRGIDESGAFKKDGYDSIWNFALGEFQLSESATSRAIKINKMFSKDGFSLELDETKKRFSKSQLIEMSYLPEKEISEVTPVMTVKEIRKKKKESQPTSDNFEVDNVSGQMQLEKDFPEYCPDPDATSHLADQAPEKKSTTKVVIDADFKEVAPLISSLPCDECGYDDKGCCSYPDTSDDYCVLGDKCIEPQTKELFVRDHPESREQLPKFRNNEERKKWLNEYKAWGLWYRDGNIDVNYYKYDFKDGSRLIVAEYPQRESTWSAEKSDEYHLHLLQKGKQKYGSKKTYDTQYCNSTDCETYLVEFIKNLQKGEK